MHQWIRCKSLIFFKKMYFKNSTTVKCLGLAAVSCTVKWDFRFNRLLAFLDSKQLSNGCLDLWKTEEISEICVFSIKFGFSSLFWPLGRKMPLFQYEMDTKEKKNCVSDFIKNILCSKYNTSRIWLWYSMPVTISRIRFFPRSLPSTN